MIDFTLGVVRRIEQSITFVESREATPTLFDTFSKQGIFSWIIRGSVIAFLLFLLYVIFAVRRRREDKPDDDGADY